MSDTVVTAALHAALAFLYCAESAVGRPRSTAPKLKLLVSAGPTFERWDRVRYVGNFSSGKMGFAIAAAAVSRGHAVTLVHGPVALAPPRGARAVAVESAREMQRELRAAFESADALVMAAAVADYRPARRLRGKFEKRNGPLSLELVRNPDIVAGLARAKGRRIVAGFALEAKAGLERARRKLVRKHLDLIVLNRPETLGSGSIEGVVLYADAKRSATTLSGRKAAVARRIVRILEELHAGREGTGRGRPQEVVGRRQRRG